MKNLKNWVSLFDLVRLKESLSIINKEMESDGFWDDHEKARKLLKEKKGLESKLKQYSDLTSEYEDILVFISLAEEEDDKSLIPEIESAYASYKKHAEQMRIRTLFKGEYDGRNAILSIHSGSGGLDAQDWALMLLRMYTRWAESREYKISILDLQNDTEGGIKNATVLVFGDYAYGYLKNEKGVHRIVRISPYDSSGRRHTSFASVDVMPEIDDDIEIDIDPDDLRVDTFRSSGAGGQHVNKTDSAIRITHIPTNIVVSCQNERSQHQNREVAMRILKSRLLELAEQEHKSKIDELKGDYSQISWGNQIRSYVFHPYSLVKDHRTNAEVGNVHAVMDGDLDYLINEKLKQK